MTANWMSGYIADVAYTLGFYRELAPTYLSFAATTNGYAAPEPEKPLRYCELGCGRGYGTVLLAAANPNSTFTGVDFNPAHIAEARNLAKRAGLTNVAFFEMSFAEAAASRKPELSDFDIVALHGVYTWVLPDVRQHILDFVRDKLVSGGLLYVSYNCMPGWAASGPMQRLLKEVGERSSRQSIAAIDEGVALLAKLTKHASAFVAHNPGAKARIERMEKQDKSYLAHEFLNAGWSPIYVTDAMKDFASAKATYIGSASLAENRIELSVPRDLIPLVRDAPDAGMRELLKDYAANKQFRRDIYVKGVQQLTPREQRRRISETYFVRISSAAKLVEKFQLPIGELKPKPQVLAALESAFSAEPRSGQDIAAALAAEGVKEPDAMLYLSLVVNAGAALPARKDFATVDRNAAKLLNQTIIEMAGTGDTHRFLASPVLGSAIPAAFADRLFVPLVKNSPDADDGTIAARAFDLLAKGGQTFRRDGKIVEKTDDNLLRVGSQVAEFRKTRLPQWQQLGAV
jgi:SAM-dependent methyltransferase